MNQSTPLLRRHVGALLAAATLLAFGLAYRLGTIQVTVQVDGGLRTVSTHAGTVGALLVEQAIPVQADDLVLPSPDARLSNGARVVVQRARPASVRVDGRLIHLRSQGRSAEDLLAQAGVELRPGDRILVNGAPWTQGRGPAIARSPSVVTHPTVDRALEASGATLLASLAIGAVPSLSRSAIPDDDRRRVAAERVAQRAPPGSDAPRATGDAGGVSDPGIVPDLPLPPLPGQVPADPAPDVDPTHQELLPGAAPEWTLDVLRAVPVTLVDRGVPVPMQMAGGTLADAIQAAGVTLYPEDEVVPSRNAPVVAGMTVTILRATPFVVEIDGGSREVRSLADTVGDGLDKAGLGLRGRDYSIPPAGDPLRAGQVVQIVRVVEDILVEELGIPYSTETVPDDSMALDETRVDRPGTPGLKTRRTRIVYENGEEVSRDIEEETVKREPVSEILAYGTQIVWRTVDTPEGAKRYWRKLKVYATSYSASRSGTPLSAPWYGRTRLGWQMRKGIVAVDPRVIPLQTNLFVPGYGVGVAGDTGGGVRRYHVDLGFDDDNYEGWHWYVDVYLLEPVPSNIPWILP